MDQFLLICIISIVNGDGFRFLNPKKAASCLTPKFVNFWTLFIKRMGAIQRINWKISHIKKVRGLMPGEAILRGNIVGI